MPIAQLNIGITRYPVDDPRMIGFTGRIEIINSIADRSDGFIWRLIDDSDKDGALDLRLPGQEDILVNMSVWRDIDSLFHYVYKTAHAKVMRDRADWFEPLKDRHLVLWYVPEGHIPSLEEANDCLQLLQANGPCPDAFTFDVPFTEAGVPISPNFPKKDCA
ncbi:MAG: DUF3291 domain-containing protein [Pseudomonadota bacterium]